MATPKMNYINRHLISVDLGKTQLLSWNQTLHTFTKGCILRCTCTIALSWVAIISKIVEFYERRLIKQRPPAPSHVIAILRDAPQYQIVCFFEHCSKGEGGVKPMFKKFCCKFGIILEAIWQYKLT